MLKDEQKLCLHNLHLDENTHITSNSKTLRTVLRKKSFDEWCQLPHKGKGVALFGEVHTMNRWMQTRAGISTTEWTTAIKLNTNTVPVRSIPGRSHDNRCRHISCNEIETLGHVLGSCPKNDLLRNVRHHKVRTMIADAFRKLQWEVHEEISCISEEGSLRRVDIIAIEPHRKSAIIIDPTIRLETSLDQAAEVHLEKQKNYSPCIPDLSKKYLIANWEVIGLLIGARAAIPKFLRNFFQQYNLPISLLKSICISVLKDSIKIIHHHLYS